jgi:hypothetical protein
MASSERTPNLGEVLETALTVPGTLGDTYEQLPDYSFLNRVRLYMQGVREPTAGYNAWRNVGRQVLRGSKGFVIVRPIPVKKTSEDEEEETFTRFTDVRGAFTYSQTTGAELPAPIVREWDLYRAETALKIRRVPYDSTENNVQGWSLDRTYAINPIAKYPFKTTIHELGHITLGHTTGQSSVTHRGIREFQAESTAHLVCNELDQLPDDAASVSRAYIQTWLRNERPPQSAIGHVFSAVETILRAGRDATIIPIRQSVTEPGGAA